MKLVTPRKSRVVDANVIAARCPTSIRLDPEFWEALDDICMREKMERNELVHRVESAAPKALRAAAVRVFILQYYRTRERAAAHREALRSIIAVAANGANPYGSTRSRMPRG